MAVLLLGLNLHSSWNWFIKSIANLAFVAFCVVSYHSWPALLGWPTERDVPKMFYLHAVQVEEPEVIYLWGTDIERGMGRTVPRAFAMPYSSSLHDRVDKATRKLRKGLPMIGMVAPTAAGIEDATSLEQVQATDSDVVFIDAPQALVPGKN